MMRTLAWFGFLLLALAATGCDSGPARYGISGEVTYKDKPIKFGTISFRADNGETGAAQIVDGRYAIPAVGGLPEGKYRVAISYPDPKIPMPTGNEPPGEALPNREMLPRKYNSESALSADVAAKNDNQADFKLD
jgi:hypothetical protein